MRVEPADVREQGLGPFFAWTLQFDNSIIELSYVYSTSVLTPLQG